MALIVYYVSLSLLNPKVAIGSQSIAFWVLIGSKCHCGIRRLHNVAWFHYFSGSHNAWDIFLFIFGNVYRLVFGQVRRHAIAESSGDFKPASYFSSMMKENLQLEYPVDYSGEIFETLSSRSSRASKMVIITSSDEFIVNHLLWNRHGKSWRLRQQGKSHFHVIIVNSENKNQWFWLRFSGTHRGAESNETS